MLDSRVSLAIRFKLGQPKIKAGFRQASSVLAIMTVPEASMHENDLTPGRKNQIGLARHFRDVKTEAVAHSVDKSPHRLFGLAPLIPNATHAFGAFARRQGVHHGKIIAGMLARSGSSFKRLLVRWRPFPPSPLSRPSLLDELDHPLG